MTTRDGQLLAVVRTDLAGVGQEEPLTAVGPDSGAVVEWLLDRLEQEKFSQRLLAVGHRVAHGGTQFATPIWLDAGTIAALRRLLWTSRPIICPSSWQRST